MAVAVVILADENAGRLRPLVERVLSHHLAVGHELLVLLAVEQRAEVVVQPSAAVVALVHDHCVAVAVLVGEQFAVDGAEALAVHGLHVDVGYLAVRHAVHDGAVAVYPTLVEQFLLCGLRDGLDGEVEAFALGVLDGEAHVLACLSVEQGVVVLACLDGLAVYLLDDGSCARLVLLHGEGAALDDLLYLQSVALVGGVEEHAEGCRGEGGSLCGVAAAGVGGVQLAQHLAQHLGEVEVVVDVGQVFLIHLAVAFPVDALQVGVIELVLHLSPDVVEEVLALLGGLVVEVRFEVHVLALLACQLHLLDVASATEEEVVHVLVGDESSASDALHHQCGASLLQVVAPEVVAVLEGSLVVDLLALVVEDGVAHTGGVDGEAHDAVSAVVDVEFEGLHLLHFGLAGLLLFLLLLVLLLLRLFVGLLLLLVLAGIGELGLLLRHAEAVVGIEVEEHQVGVVLGSPGTVAAVAGAVALEEHRLAAQYPLAVAVAVAAVGEVVHLLAVGLHEGDVGVVPSAVADVAREEPLAVGAPLKPDVAVGVGVVVLAVEHRAHLLRLEVDDAQGGAVLVECYLLAVGTVGGILRGEVGLGELLLLDVGAVSEAVLLLVLDFRLENLPYAVAL